MFKTFNKESSNEFISNLNKDIDKSAGHRSKFFAPDEDPDGCFHELSSAIVRVSSVNYKYREILGKYLLSKNFQDQLYLNVGKFLGYTNKEIKKNNIKKKISDAVISSTFQDEETLDENQKKRNWPFRDSVFYEQKDIRSGNFKYLDIKDNFYYHIFPSEKKNIFAPYYIENDNLIINDAGIDIQSSKLKYNVDVLPKNIIGRSFDNKPGQNIFCDLNKSYIIGSYSGKHLNDNRSESFYRDPPLSFSTKSAKTKFKLESNLAYLQEYKNKNTIRKNIFDVTIKKSFIGRGKFNGFINSKVLSKNKRKYLFLSKISRKITSKDLILDAEWYKLDSSHEKQVKFSLKNNHLNDQIKDKGLWLYRFKNTDKNRKKLHEFFSKNNFKTKFWTDKKYRTRGGSDYLVSGDFIVNVDKYFRYLDFPLNSEKKFKKIYSRSLKSVSEAVELTIQWAIGSCMLNYLDSQNKNYKKIFSILKKYTKPVNINESFQFIKGQLEASKRTLIKDAGSFYSPNNDSFVRHMTLNISMPNDYLFPRRYLDPLVFENSNHLHKRVWKSIQQEKILLRDQKSIGVGNENVRQVNAEAKNSLFAKEKLIKNALDDFKKNIEANPSKISNINEWLKAEQLDFCQSYYENFENHPAQKDRTTKRFKKILKEYKNKTNERVKNDFLTIYKEFVSDTLKGDLSPEKKVRNLWDKLDIEMKKKKKWLGQEYEKLPKKPKKNRLNSKFSKKYLSPRIAKEDGLSKSDMSKEEFINSCLHIQQQVLQQDLNFPRRGNYLNRFLTDSYKNDGKEMKALYQILNDTEKELEKNIKDDKKRQKIQDRLNAIIQKLRRWLVWEEMNNLEKNEGSSFKIFKRGRAKKFFYYPNYNNTSLERIFSLKIIYSDIWDNDIVDSVLNIVSLIQLDNTLANDLDIAITKRLDGLRKNGALSEELLSWEIIQNFVNIQKTINFHRAFYGVADSFFKVISFLEGFFAYSVSTNEVSKMANFAGQRNKFSKSVENEFNINNSIYLWDSQEEKIHPLSLDILQNKINDNDFTFVQNKEETFTTIHNEINSLIKVYEKVFDKIINTFEEETAQRNVGFFPLQASLTYPLEALIGTWETLNHLKAIKNYINLIEKYDLYEINDNFKQADYRFSFNERSYITKQDANFLYRKSNTTHSISSLNELSDYLTKNTKPKYQNDIKYRPLLKILRANSIKIKKINGVDCIEKKAFIEYLRTSMGYRNLKKLHYPNVHVRNLGFNSLTAQEEDINF